MAGQYAAGTDVSSEKSRIEIERTLHRYGAEEFGYATRAGRSVVQFTAENRRVQFAITLPDRNSREFTKTATGRDRSRAQAELAYEQAIRQKWRALSLVVKAKLEAVASGITTFEEEFLSNILLPGGGTVYDNIRDGIEQSYINGAPAPLIQIEAGR